MKKYTDFGSRRDMQKVVSKELEGMSDIIKEYHSFNDFFDSNNV